MELFINFFILQKTIQKYVLNIDKKIEDLFNYTLLHKNNIKYNFNIIISENCYLNFEFL